MNKRKFSDDEEEILEVSAACLAYKRRRRRVSDVIDSQGVDLLANLKSPTRVKDKSKNFLSPDLGYCSSPSTPGTSRKKEPRTPEVPTKKVTTDSPTVNYSYCEASVLSEASALMVTEKDSASYKMNHLNRGKCVVFNHEIFNNNSNREGSSNDALKIKETFQKLGFHVTIFDNLTYCEVINRINKLSQEDYSQSDCICVFMLTHGTYDDLIYAKDVAYKSDEIWKPFTADKCKSLAGKPKLFFFQNCRGDQLDKGVVLHSTEIDSSVKAFKLPNYADFLCAYSTVQGFYSWRNPVQGTWYIQTLCDVIEKHHSSTDLLKMLTITARRIATDFASYNDLNPNEDDMKQVPCVASMLLRDIYFT